MSAGKKVFTKAGEYLAEFLLTNEKRKEDVVLLETIDKLNSTSYSGATQAYNDSFTIDKEQLQEFFKNELLKELSLLRITDGTKDIILQEALQKTFNEVKYIDTLTRAHFEAIAEMVCERIAEIFHELGTHNRKFTRSFQQLAAEIAALYQKPLDYFVGGTDDKSRLYYRFDSAQLLISNAKGNSAGNFKELFKVTSKVVGTAEELGDEIVFGGTEADSPFKKIRFTKEITTDKNITLTGDAELIGTAMKARYADLAELYTSDTPYEPGTLVQINPSNKDSEDWQLTIYNPQMDIGYFGVVSHKPGFILNHKLESEHSVIPIVMSGQTPVNVSNKCFKGDYIYPSPYYSDFGCAVAIEPIKRLNFEKDYPLLKCIGQVLDTDSTEGIKKVNCRIY